ncbi:MAG TPA: NrsF family protein [bacterium]|nr:NrsF family protein [bacterium]
MKDAARRANLMKAHQRLVEELVQTPPARLRRGLDPRVQWILWFGLMVLALAGLVLFLGPRPGLWLDIQKPGFGIFFALVLVGGALSAWGAILSGIPGRSMAAWQKAILGFALAGLVLSPFVFFPAVAPDVDGSRLDDDWCFPLVLAVGFLPWVGLGSILARNASFRPALTGVFSGTSAFLMASGALYLCCPCWTRGHILMAHLLPVALASFATAFLGSYWFSRWMKKS